MMWAQTSFQDATSPNMKTLILFHDNAMLLICLIVGYVFFVMSTIMLVPISTINPYEHHELETIWTLFPAMILICLAMPSLQLLYTFDEMSNPIITLKTVGHQWYWSYDYADFMNLEFDSYMTPTIDLNQGDFRLLEVDNRMVLPWGIEARILVTAADVLHSWTIPSLGVKADAVPGRLNQTTIFPLRTGVFYGQCSEICGANHSFMPISLETITPTNWSNWINSVLTNEKI